MGRLLGLLLLLASCSLTSSELVIDRVEPGFGPSASDVPVQLEGAFHMPLTSNLDRGDTIAAAMTVTVGGVALANATWRDEKRIDGTVLAGLPSGPADVVVTLGGQTDLLVGGYVVDGTGVAPGDSRELLITGLITGGPHADFPLLVAISDPWLRTTTLGGQVAHPQGFDIFFSEDATGTIRLAHEIERFAGDTGGLVAWVKIPQLSPTSRLFIHAGDATVVTSLEDRPAVWSADYAAVWHLTDLADSTTQNPGTDAGTTSESGQIESARTFNGTTSVINVASSPSVDNIFDGGGTIEAWFFATGNGESNFGRVFEKGLAGGITLAMCAGQGIPNSVLFAQVFSGTIINWCTSANAIALDDWFHVAVVYNADSANNRPLIYINGVSVQVNGGQPTGTRVTDAGDPLTIGDRQPGARAFAGTIDEARLSRTLRDPGWIATSHLNQRDPGSFVTFAP